MIPAVGLFTRRHPPEVRATAAAGTATTAALSLIAPNTTAVGRERAMRIPTVSRARDLICSMVASLNIEHYGTQWTGERLERIPLPPEPWMVRPEQRVPRAHTLAWTVDDLYFYGRAHWYITARRSSDGRPYGFLRLPAAQVMVEATNYAANVPLGEYSLSMNGENLPTRDVVTFWSPVEGMLRVGARAFFTAERLDQAATRFASVPTGLGYLKQVGGEPLSGDELADLADAWVEARTTDNSIAALNEFVEFRESTMDPSKLQLTEAREYQAKELARLGNVPAYLLGIDQSGMTYANAQQSRQDLWLFAALPYAKTITEQLSGDDVTPRGHVVEFDVTEWVSTADALPTDPSPAPSEAPA
jgi:phage portal protein BeeE